MTAPVAGQVLRSTYRVEEEIVVDTALGSIKPDYLLCEADAIRLTESTSTLETWRFGVLFLTFGYAVSVAAKYFVFALGLAKTSVENWEIVALAIGAGATLALYISSYFFPSRRRKLLREIEVHFDTHPRQRHMMRKSG